MYNNLRKQTDKSRFQRGCESKRPLVEWMDFDKHKKQNGRLIVWACRKCFLGQVHWGFTLA